MKRGAPLRRTALSADPAKADAWRRRSRKRLPVRSMKAKAAVEQERQVREQVFARDGHRCALNGIEGAGTCFGVPTFQHRRKASQGGAYSVENGATLCAHHNGRIEADADLARLARTLGLVLRRGDES